MRTIKIVDTASATVKRYESAATTWGEVLETASEDFNFGKSKATIRENKLSLEREDSVLPEGDFTVFLRPAKNKAGLENFLNKSFKELRAWIKENPGVKEFFKANPVEGRNNWTQYSLEELAESVQSYYDSLDSKSETVEEAPKAEVAEIVESVKNAKETAEEECDDCEEITGQIYDNKNAVDVNKIDDLSTQDKLNQMRNLIESVLEDFLESPKFTSEDIDTIENSTNNISDEIAVLDTFIVKWNKSEEELLAEAEALRAIEDEDAALLREAKELSDGYFS